MNLPMSGQLREAFNAAAAPDAIAEKAFQRYVRHDNVEMERIRFVGRFADGTILDIESGNLKGGSDLLAAAREIAAEALAEKRKATPPAQEKAP